MTNSQMVTALKKSKVNLIICCLALIITCIYVYSQVCSINTVFRTGDEASAQLARAIEFDAKKQHKLADEALEKYFASKTALLPPNEVARLRFFRAKADSSDYFDMLAETRGASVWPRSGMPITVFVGDFSVFGKNTDSIIHDEVRKSFDLWRSAAPDAISYRLVNDIQSAKVKIVPEIDAQFMPLQGALADTSWEEDGKKSNGLWIPVRRSATVRIVDPKLGVSPSSSQLNSLRASLLHEIGHVLGINSHSANASDTMFALENAAPASLQNDYTLSERDKTTIRKLYATSVEKDALARIEQLANENDPYACQALGTMFYRGEGKPLNDNEARKWFEKSAAQKLPAGMALLAEMSFSGRGTKKDYAKAFQLYQEAAALSSADACINLGFMYANGLGVKKDYAKSREFYEKASKQGIATATFNLGVVYENGTGTEKDYKKAVDYYERAAAQGSSYAVSALSALYYTGRGVERNYNKGFELAQRAAESAEGKVKMGDIYFYGLGTERDAKKAMDWYEKGARQGSSTAMLRLAGMYIWGRGVPRDFQKAISYYKQAEWLGMDAAKQAQSNLDMDDAIGDMMRGEFKAAALAFEKFLAKAQVSYYDELERNFFYAAAYANLAWRHIGDENRGRRVALDVLHKRTSQEWPRQAVEYLTGKMKEQQLLEFVGDDLEKLTEAKYIIGANDVIEKDPARAKADLGWVIREGRKDFFEYVFAEKELEMLDKRTR